MRRNEIKLIFLQRRSLHRDRFVSCGTPFPDTLPSRRKQGTKLDDRRRSSQKVHRIQFLSTSLPIFSNQVDWKKLEWVWRMEESLEEIYNKWQQTDNSTRNSSILVNWWRNIIVPSVLLLLCNEVVRFPRNFTINFSVATRKSAIEFFIS